MNAYLWLPDRNAVHAGEQSTSGNHRDEPVLHGVLSRTVIKSGN